MAGRELGVAEQRIDGGLSTRGACSNDYSQVAYSLGAKNKQFKRTANRSLDIILDLSGSVAAQIE